MNILEPTPENIRLAADAVRAGKLVGMPTETVYGVAGDATNPAAAVATFAAKERPADNPLIVHIAHLRQLDAIVTSFPERAERLAAAFWPGPLTIVLPKKPSVPGAVTGGKDTVAVRVPGHPVALRLIDEAGVPVSAPSANLFMALSPTRVEHIDPHLAARLEMILDGGPCEVGLESTVVDLSGDRPVLLRPGGITRQDIEAILGETVDGVTDGERRSPGMYPRHYAPRTPVRIVSQLDPELAGLGFDARSPMHVQMSRNAVEYAVSLYAALHRLDAEGYAEILVEAPPRTAEWEAVWDRLSRATTQV